MHDIAHIYKKYLQAPNILTDSRIKNEDAIFVALKGERYNGNDFAITALNNGCKFAIVDENRKEFNDERIITVNNALNTLQKLAAHHRNALNIKVLAITGSNGKTTTKELIKQVLSAKYNCYATQGNLNNHIGVPLTLLQLKQVHEIAIIEMGANHKNEIATLTSIAKPDTGLITNIGKAHIEGFGSLQGVLHAKTELFDYLNYHKKHIIYNTNDPWLIKKRNKYTCSISEYGNQSGVWAKVLDSNNALLKVCVYGADKNTPVEINSRLSGAYNAENIVAACAVGNYFGVNFLDIKEQIEKYAPTNNRSQVIKSPNNIIYSDAYNANPSSMHLAINEFINTGGHLQQVVILGEMNELGNTEKQEHDALTDMLKKHRHVKVYLVGEKFKTVAKGFEYFTNTNELVDYLKKNPIKGCSVLLKGSRTNQLEKLINLL